MFDVNTPYKLIEVMGNNHFVYEYDDIFYTWVNQYYEEDNLIDFYIDFFVKNEDNSYQRIRETQTEKVYSLDAIRFMLYNSGFNTVKMIDFDTGKCIIYMLLGYDNYFVVYFYFVCYISIVNENYAKLLEEI